MFKNKRKKAHPILDGKALVSVSLKNEKSGDGWYEKLARSIKYYFLNKELSSYFFRDNSQAAVPIVKLNEMTRGIPDDTSLELNLNKDRVPVFSKIKLALGGATATGLIVLAAWGLGAKATRHINPDADPGANFNMGSISDSEKQNSGNMPVLIAQNDKEAFLYATLVEPGARGRHRFRFLGHSNIAHTNQVNHNNYNPGSSLTHKNIQWDPYDVTVHTNWENGAGGHSNIHNNTTTPHANGSSEW